MGIPIGEGLLALFRRRKTFQFDHQSIDHRAAGVGRFIFQSGGEFNIAQAVEQFGEGFDVALLGVGVEVVGAGEAEKLGEGGVIAFGGAAERGDVIDADGSGFFEDFGAVLVDIIGGWSGGVGLAAGEEEAEEEGISAGEMHFGCYNRWGGAGAC